jgi:signal peptidase I
VAPSSLPVIPIHHCMNTHSTSTTANAPAAHAPAAPSHHPQVVRETLESLAVAFLLALMFKAFIAEAFVIPTGSMAPTLMGAHKDVTCDDCGYPYQCGASSEFSDTGAKTGAMIFGTVCPLCRKPQILDLQNNANHRTFSGDRILVSKLAYVFSKPQRWDVFVFKYIEDARLNYIKRCLGRPDEAIRIEHGDVFVSDRSGSEGDLNKAAGNRSGEAFEIARKPPHVVGALLQPISDSKYRSKTLLDAGVPDAWHSEPKEGSPAWSVRSEDGVWNASISGVPAGAMTMLRYRHRILDPLQWEELESGKGLPVPVAPDSYRLITDFTAYNAHLTFAGRFESVPANYRDIAPLERRRVLREGFMARGFTRPMENDGLHWTGDLCGEWELTTDPGTQALRLLLVEAGVEHRCDIDLATGTATATLVAEEQRVAAFEDGSGGLIDRLQAATSLRAGGRHRLKFANVDDAIYLWVDGRPIAWGAGGQFSVRRALPGWRHTPKTSLTNPLDAAPVGIGVEGGGCTVAHAKVSRDVYYIAHSSGDYLTDYNNVLVSLKESASKEVRAQYLQKNHRLTDKQYTDQSTPEALDRNALVSNVQAWSGSFMDKERRNVTFELGADAYLPLGDNSSASADARSWREHHVPERLMIGRAVLVFWPHYWNAPIPFLPNFQRMGLIR